MRVEKTLLQCGLICVLSVIAMSQSTATKFGGHVTDLMGNPIAGAQVELIVNNPSGSQTAITDATGAYELVLIRDGYFEVVVRARGFKKRKIESSYYTGGIREFDFGLEVGVLADLPGHIIKGTVFENRQPAKRVRVTLLSVYNYDITYTTESDEYGNYSISVPQPGKYIIFAVPKGHQVCTTGLVVPPALGETKTIAYLHCD